MVETPLYKEAVEKFGHENQMLVTIGELSECAAELARYLIPQHKEDNTEELLDEMADAYIMLRQMEIIFGDDLHKAIFKKLKKVQKHVHG